MGFTEAIKTCLTRKYATFEGRAARSEYWWFTLFYVLVGIALMLLGFALGGVEGLRAGRINWLALTPAILFGVAMMLPIISVSVRRLHDRDMSGWWYLGFTVLSNIPYVGAVVGIVWFVINCLKGTAGPNRFGRDPLGSAFNADVFA
jgi:uncharacterized membrane protein YhaH (DUF805 family)